MQTSKLQRALEMMIRTNRMHKAVIDSKVKEIGIHRTQHRILMHLARHNTLASQKELAEHLDVTPAAVTVALKKIEQDGYIKRRLGADNRFNEVEITEKGRLIVEKTRDLFSATDISLFDGFSDEDIEAYLSCLSKMQDNIKRYTEVKDCLGDTANTEEENDEKMV